MLVIAQELSKNTLSKLIQQSDGFPKEDIMNTEGENLSMECLIGSMIELYKKKKDHLRLKHVKN